MLLGSEVAMEDHAGDIVHDIRPLVRRLGKQPAEWQRRDLVDLCLQQPIRVINFRYPSLDGKLRELRLPVNEPAYMSGSWRPARGSTARAYFRASSIPEAATSMRCPSTDGHT